MAQAPLSRFPIRITAPGGDADAATIEDFAQTLRTELIDAGAHRIERVSAGAAPDGTRSLELIGLLSFIITATDAGESLIKVIRAIRAVAQRYAKARRPVQVTVGESNVDLATADDDGLAAVIATIMASAPTGVRAALIVANAAYDHAGLTELRAPGADADALAGVLRDPTIGGFEVELLTDGDERTIRRRLAAFFARRDRDDVLLLHFSCHGVKDFRGRLYFAARDTDLDALGATAVPASFVSDLLDETLAGRVVLILDCCYSGAFARGAATRGEDAVHVNDEFGGGTGRVVLTASSATEYAFEGTAVTRADGQPSVFTSALVDGLASGAADLDEDGDITIDELYDYTYRAVRRATPAQAPMKWSYGVEGSVVIARSGRQPALPRTILDDLESDRGVLRLEGVRALGRVVRDGTPGLRAAAIDALRSLEVNDDSIRVRDAAAGVLSSVIPQQRTSAPISATKASARPATVARQEPAPPQAITEPADPPSPTRLEPPAARPTPAPRRLGVAEAPPSARVSRATPTSPTPTDANVLTGVRLIAMVLACLLAFAAAVQFVLTVKAHPDTGVGKAGIDVMYGVLSAAAAVALITRRRTWAGVLAGLLAWHAAFPVAISSHPVHDTLGDTYPPLLTATILALVAFAFAVAAALPIRDSSPMAWRRAIVAFVVAPLAVTSGIVLFEVIVRLYDDDVPAGRAIRMLFAGAAALVVLAAGLLAPRDRASHYLLGGWLVGGAIFAVTGLTDPNLADRWRFATWIPLAATGIAAAVAFRRGSEPRSRAR